jgi:hypothetical protein
LKRFNEYDDLFGIKQIFQTVFEIYDEKQTQKFMIQGYNEKSLELALIEEFMTSLCLGFAKCLIISIVNS